MKKILAIISALLLLMSTLVSCEKEYFSDDNADTKKAKENQEAVTDNLDSNNSSSNNSNASQNAASSNTNQKQSKLANKTPKELYSASADYLKSLQNYEIVIESKYKTTYNGQISNETVTSSYKSSGDTFCYNYQSQNYEELFLHDGNFLYRNFNTVRERIDISYEDFITSFDNVTDDGLLISLPDKMFEQKSFNIDGEKYYLDFTISVEDYEEIAGGTVNSPVSYKVYFDNAGNIISFTRSMTYYYYNVVLVEDNITVSIKNVDTVEKINAPDNAEDFAVRPKAEEIDISTIESLDGFEQTSDISDYVLLKMKIGDYSGEILIRLFPDVAPITVSNFQSLVNSSFYDGLTMHRVIKNFVIQGGDPAGNGTGGSDTDIFGEFTSNGFTNNLSHKRGVVSMARSDDPDSGSSQFFICHDDILYLDENYAAFGFVVYGMDTVDYIANLETDSNDTPITTVTIERAIFVKKHA